MKKASFLDTFGRTNALNLIGQATQEAAQAALNGGLPVTFAKDGVLYRKLSNGQVEPRFKVGRPEEK